MYKPFIQIWMTLDLFKRTYPLMLRFQQWVADVRLTYKIIFASAGIAFAIGLFYMLIMRYFAGLLTWTAIFLYFVGVVLFIIYLKD